VVNLKKTKSTLVVVLVSLVFLKALDIAFYQIAREKIYAEPLRKSSDRSIALREYGPNQHSVYDAGNTHPIAGIERELGRYVFNIDKNGFIETGNPVLPDADSKVLFLGGSTTETLLVEERNRFPSVVERALRDDPGLSINVFNGGVSGNNSMHSLTKLIAKGIPLRPDFAIMMHNVNDLHALSTSASYWRTPEITNLVIVNFEQGFLKRMVVGTLRSTKNAIIPNLYGYLKPRLELNFSASANVTTRQTIEGKGINQFDIEEQFRSSLISFARVCRAWNIRPILMTQFNRYHMSDELFQFWHVENPAAAHDPEEFVSLYARFNDIIREVAKSEDVILIDLAKAVPADDVHMYDTVHLTDEGSILVANIITEKLKTVLK
jgi:lysophospholipase L1-like esterase